MQPEDREEDHGIEPDHASEEELQEIIEHAKMDGSLNDVEYGVAQQLLGDGYDSLSLKQKFIYDKFVAPLVSQELVQRKVQRIHDSNPD